MRHQHPLSPRWQLDIITESVKNMNNFIFYPVVMIMKKISILRVKSFLLATLATTQVCIANAQEGSWVQDRSRPTREQLLDKSGYFHPSPSEYNLGTLGHFHLRGSILHTPKSPSILERVRFLVFTNYAGSDPSPLFRSNSRVGVVVTSEAAFDEFSQRGGVVTDIGKIISVPVSASHVVRTGNVVDINATNVRILRSLPHLPNFQPNPGQLLEVELLLPTPFRLQSDTDIRIAPFIDNWNSSTYNISFMSVIHSDSRFDQDASYFLSNAATLPKALDGYWSSNGVYNYNSDYNGLPDAGGFIFPNTRLALGAFLKPVKFSLVIGPSGKSFQFSNAQCLIIQKSLNLTSWSDLTSISGSATTTLPYVSPAGESSAFFRLIEKDISNQGSCLLP